MSRLFDLPRPIIFAHRGASAYAPENTLASFRKAVEMGAPAIELDAKLTADGAVVVIHDPTLDRTTNGTGNVKRAILKYLKSLDAGSWFSRDYSGEQIPTLDEVFEEVGKKIFINVELTNYHSSLDGLPVKVVDLVKRHGLDEWVMFSSFQPLNLMRTRFLMPQVPTAQLALESKAGRLGRDFFPAFVSPKIVHPYLEDATSEWVQGQHQRSRRVHVWTVNDPRDMRRLFGFGVDGIFTDDPVAAIKLIHEQ